MESGPTQKTGQDRLDMIADELGVTVDYLIYGEDGVEDVPSPDHSARSVQSTPLAQRSVLGERDELIVRCYTILYQMPPAKLRMATELLRVIASQDSDQ